MGKKLKIILIIASALLLSVAGLFLYRYSANKDPYQKTDFWKNGNYESENFSEKNISPVFLYKYYVSPLGNDGNDGLSPEKPLFTIQKAVDLAEPGSIITLAQGTYMQDVISKRDGTAKNPIRITGSPSSILKGKSKARIIEINHSHLIIDNFTIDGLFGNPAKKSDYRDKLIYVQGKDKKNWTTGIRLQDLILKNAGGECIRLRYFATKNAIINNTITGCGIYDFRFGNGEDGKNGEGIYIGTAPEQRDDDNNPTEDKDASNGNLIRGNLIDTQGNECIDIKEGSSGNIIEKNICTGQKDSESAGLGSRGSGNVFRNNEVYGNAGAGIRLGGDKKKDGVNNDAYSNTLRDNQGGGIKIMRYPQGKVCGNIMSNNGSGEFTGEYQNKFSNESCD